MAERPPTMLSRETGVATPRLIALPSAGVGLGLLGKEGDRYLDAGVTRLLVARVPSW